MTDNAAFDARLTTLWNGRASLSQTEWAELYGLVTQTLKNCRANRFDGLRESREDYVQGFFVDKVLQAAQRDYNERIMTGNYLLGFFHNYLKDQRDNEMRRGAGLTDSLDEAVSDDDGDSKLAYIEDCREFNFSEDEVEDVLAQYQLSRVELDISAKEFFGQLQLWQQQVISRHLCADPEHALALSQLQEQFPQTATYYKVKQLGILHSARHPPDDYHKTEIGRWLVRGLKLNLTMVDSSILGIALQVLCMIASQRL